NHNGVFLDAKTVLNAGGTLQFRQSVSNFTSPDPNVVVQGNAGFHLVRNTITGQGSTAREAAVDIYLPVANGASNAGNIGGPVTGLTGGGLGGVDFQGTRVSVIVNGVGVGGLRVNGFARPGVLISGTNGTPDPVTNVDK